MTEAIMNESALDESFVIDTDAKAGWALKKIKDARDERDRMVKWYKDRIADIEAETDFNTMNLEKMLMQYFLTVPHKKTKAQESYAMPGGKLIMKVQAPEYKRDDKKVIDWLKENGGAGYVKVKEELDWAGLKAVTAVFGENVVNEDGEIIPGIEVVAREPKFVVEV